MPRALPNCCICFSNDDQDWSALQCGHVFHTECVKKALRLCNKKCPKCRKVAQSIQKLFLEFEDEAVLGCTQLSGDAAFEALQSKHRELQVEHSQLQQKAKDLEEVNGVLLQQADVAAAGKAEYKRKFKDCEAELQRLSVELRNFKNAFTDQVARHQQEVDLLETRVSVLSTQLEDERQKARQLASQKQSKFNAERVAKNPSMHPLNIEAALQDCTHEDLIKLCQKRTAELNDKVAKIKQLQTDLNQLKERSEHELTAAKEQASQLLEERTRQLEDSKRKLNQYELQLANLKAAAQNTVCGALPVPSQDEDGPFQQDFLEAGDEEQTQCALEETENVENDDPALWVPSQVPAKPKLMGVAKGAPMQEAGPSFLGKSDPHWSQGALIKQGADGRGGTSRVLAPLSGNKFRASRQLPGAVAKKAKKSTAGTTTLHSFGFCKS